MTRDDDIKTARAHELLAQRAIEGLDLEQLEELDELGVADDYSFELAAAAIQLATVELERMPVALVTKIIDDQAIDTAEFPRPSRHTATMQIARPRPTRAHVYPLAVAACLVLAIGTIWWALTRGPEIRTIERVVEVPRPASPRPTAREARAELLATARDVVTLAWQPTADPNGANASGDIVWSASAQRGFMRFRGLVPNDAHVMQYQLWIFDKARDQAFPVDGGVFDVSSIGEVTVPISATLFVHEPVLFAVTIEEPGGVVVSKRERIVVTAAAGKSG